jgi:DNA-binding GntR family transcriptional regulator
MNIGKKIIHKSLTELTTDNLRELILRGEFKSGERLIEEKLTARLGVSRPALRESFRTLTQEGLIVSEPRKGSSVASFESEDLQEILALRSALERFAIEIAIPIKDESQLNNCWEALRAMEEDVKTENRGKLVRDALTFHTSIVALSNNRRLISTYTSLSQELLVCMTHNLYAREHHEETLKAHVARHRELLEAIESGNKKAILNKLAHHGEGTFVLQQKRRK